MYIHVVPSSDHSLLTLKLPFKMILRKFEVFWCLEWEWCTFKKIDEYSLKSTNITLWLEHIGELKKYGIAAWFQYIFFFMFFTGNNIYDDEVKSMLLKLTGSQEREAFVLMDRILPPIHQNYILRVGSDYTSVLDVVSELGIFGAFVR